MSTVCCDVSSQAANSSDSENSTVSPRNVVWVDLRGLDPLAEKRSGVLCKASFSLGVTLPVFHKETAESSKAGAMVGLRVSEGS